MAAKNLKTPKKQSKTIVRRKRKGTIEDMDTSKRYLLLSDYKTGEYDFGQLTDKYNLKDKEQLRRWVNTTIQELNIVKETSALNPKTQQYYAAYQPNNLINEPFLKLLSPPDAPSLTDHESSWAYQIVFLGNEAQAFEETELDVGLSKYKSKGTRAYQMAIRTRGIFLRAKENVKRELDRLRTLKYKEITKDISKDWVVNELVDIVYQLKESGSNPKLLLETIEKIGKTCGAFVERVQIEKLSAAKPLARLVELAQQEVVPTDPADIEEHTAEIVH